MDDFDSRSYDMWREAAREEEEAEEAKPHQEPMTLEQVRDHAVHLAKTGREGALWSFLLSSDGCRLLDYEHIREKTLKSVKLYLDSIKAGTRKTSPDEQLAAVQLYHNINMMNHIQKNYERSGIYTFPKGTPHLKR